MENKEKFVNKVCNNSKLKVGDIITKYYYINGKKQIQDKIVALKNNRRILIDMPNGVF